MSGRTSLRDQNISQSRKEYLNIELLDSNVIQLGNEREFAEPK